MYQQLPTEPLCDQHSPPVFYLDRRAPSSQRGGTRIADDVVDWQEHLRRLESPEGYRPEECLSCGCRRLHGHGRRCRVLPGDELELIEIRRYRCSGCGAIWQVLPGLLARRLWRRWEVVDDALKRRRRVGRRPVPGRTRRRWRAKLRSCGRVVRHILGTAQRPEAAATVRRTRLSSTRGELLGVYAEETKGEALPELAALLHRLAPGVRMM